MDFSRLRSHASKIALGLALLASCAVAQVPDEITDEGLVRVPSSRAGRVYRSPEVNFVQYRRLTFDPVRVSFKPGWRRQHRKLTEAQVERIRSRAATQFHEELVSELVDRGHYQIAEAAAPDVLRIKTLIADLDQVAPTAGNVPGERSYTRMSGNMLLVVEMYDAASGVLVGRIVDPERARQYQQPQPVDQVSIETESRLAFANAARLTREALNVAINQRPR